MSPIRFINRSTHNRETTGVAGQYLGVTWALFSPVGPGVAALGAQLRRRVTPRNTPPKNRSRQSIQPASTCVSRLSLGVWVTLGGS